jgi:hypothetical protein
LELSAFITQPIILLSNLTGLLVRVKASMVTRLFKTDDMSYILPEIDFKYWADKNPYYSSDTLSKEVKIGLTNASKAGLVSQYLPTIASNSDLVNLILKKIAAFDFAQTSDDQSLLIFDLIQSWGGAMGKWPFVKPKGNPPRPNDHKFSARYFKAIKALERMKTEGVTEDSISSVNKLMCELPMVSESFSTKHLQFWSIGLDIKPRLAIYDTRMILLMAAANGVSKSHRHTYLQFLEALDRTSLKEGLPPEIVERSLFAFSKAFFPNAALQVTADCSIAHDRQAAVALETWWLSS